MLMRKTFFFILMVNGYIAAPKDDSLEEYLIESLYLLEMRFENFDTDGAG